MEESGKVCPFMMIALAAKANDKAFLFHAKCMSDQCEMWDEFAGRCGLVSIAAPPIIKYVELYEEAEQSSEG